MANVTVDGDKLVTEPMALDRTLQGVNASIDRLVLLKEAELEIATSDLFSIDTFSSMIASGSARVAYQIGSTMSEKWDDPRPNNNTKWDYKSRLAAYETIRVKGGFQRRAATFHSKLALPFGLPFSPYQAFLCAGENGLPAGTYHVKMGFNWGTNVVANKYYQFTLTQALPAGGQLAGFRGAPDQAPSNWRVYAYASATATTETETCVVTEGSGGADLGTFTAAGYAVVPASGTPSTMSSVTVGGTSYSYYGLNSLHRVAYGNNRWLHSPQRQFLNGVGLNWWSPATVFDRPPDYVGYKGFLTGFPEELVDHMAQREIKTSLNTVTDGGTSNGAECDVTYDKVWLPSSEQMNLACTSLGIPYGVEGDAFEYWVMVYGSTPATYWTTHTEFCMASMDAPTTMRGVFQRSPSRSYGYLVAYVSASGGVGSHYAVGAYYVAPAYSII